MMYSSTFWKFLTFNVHINKSTNNMAAKNGQINWTIQNVSRLFEYKYLKCNKTLRQGVLVPEKHMVFCLILITMSKYALLICVNDQECVELVIYKDIN